MGSSVIKKFISYVVNNVSNKYPSNGLHTDGYYYELFGGPPVKIVTWADGTDAEIVAMVNAADEGRINLADYWSVGDERQVTLSAMEATGVGESHVEQTVTFVLMNAGGKTLVNATPSGRSECSFIVGMKNGLAEKGYMNSSDTNNGGWDECARRTWCNNVFKNSIPSTLQEIFKQHHNVTSWSGSSTRDSTDYFALPAEKEIFGSVSEANATAESSLTQFQYYVTPANRLKKAGGGQTYDLWFSRSRDDSSPNMFCVVNNNTDPTYQPGGDYASDANLISPFGVI